MDDAFLDLEITLLTMEGKTAEEIADKLGLTVERVINSRRKDSDLCYTDSDDFGFGSFI